MGIFDEIRDFANPFYGGILYNPGRTGQAGDGGAPGVDLTKFIGGGTFQEGTLANVLNHVKGLKQQLGENKISQGDYIKELSQVMPAANDFIRALYGGGSTTANAAKAAGAEELLKLQKEYEVYKNGQELLGRDLTPQEFAQILPRFADNIDTGRAYLAEMAKQEEFSPANLAKKATQYSGQIGGFYQDLLNRGASAEEADYFGRLMASGQVTPYEIQQFIRATPEFQQREDKAFREGLEGELAGYDEKAFARERENILSQYTKAGLQNSSALDFAITEALGKMQEQRGAFLGQLSASQYGGNKDAARRDYETQRNRYFDQQDYGRGRSDAYMDYLTQRADEGADYTRQRDDYLRFLSSQPKQRGPGVLDYLAGGGQFLGGIGDLVGGFRQPSFNYLNS